MSNLPLASHHSITSSAMESTSAEMVRPSMRAIWALNDQFELGRLHDRQFRRLRALEDAAGIDADLAIHFDEVGAVTYQPARLDVWTHRIGRRKCMARGQRGQLDASG